MSMDPETQVAWDAWANGLIENRIVRLRDALGDALGETTKELLQRQDDAVATLRREMRDSPPLFAAPDKKLAVAMTRVGEELHAIREGIEAARAGEAKREARTKHTADTVAGLRRQIAELTERNESTEKNLHGINTMVFNLSNSLRNTHALLTRMAAALDCDVLTPLDKHIGGFAAEEKPSGVVLRLADLRHAS
jgi:chromosome segregation ATPase